MSGIKKNDYLKRNNNKNNNKLRSIICSIYVCYYLRLTDISKRCEYKSPTMGSLTDVLIELSNNPEISDSFLNKSIKLIAKFLNMGNNNIFANKIPEIYKLISKNERYNSSKIYLLKCIYGSLLYYENKDLVAINFFHKKYNFLMELLENYFQLKQESINNLAIKTFIFLHDKILFIL